jgi:hypothetical protein
MNDPTPHENSNQLLQTPNQTQGRTYSDYNLRTTHNGGQSLSMALMTEIWSCGIRTIRQTKRKNHRSERSENGTTGPKSNRHQLTSFKLAMPSLLPGKVLSTPLPKLAIKQSKLTTQNYHTRILRNQPVLRRQEIPHTRNGFKLK